MFCMGLLCKCSTGEAVFDEAKNEWITDIKHTNACEGRIKLAELLTEIKSEIQY